MQTVRWSVTLLSAVCLLACLPAASPARVLGLFPYKGASHFYVFRPLLEELARRGHEVHVASHHPKKNPLTNYTDISLVDASDPPFGFMDFDIYEKMETNVFTNLMGLKFLTMGYERAHSLPRFLALVNSSYDVVITEMFNSDVFFGLTYKIGAPVIGFSSCQVLTWSADTFGAPNDLAYVPNIIGGRGPDMDFLERVYNFLEIWIARLFFRFVIQPDAQAVAEKFLGPLPDLNDIAANVSLVFVNSHFSLLGQRPLPQSIIEVGGINVGDVKPLPKDLEKIMNDSKGVIYFSMGSVLKGSSMSMDKQEMFINAFLASGKTVFWKREENLSPEHPNIITSPWLPQRDILGHPKTELFISHCGLLGVNEAVVSGVPIVCIPMFGDQPSNARYVANSGMGLTLRFATITEAEIRSALSEILNNKRFKKRASEISAAYRDRPMSPLSTAVYWTEYLIRHGPRPFAAPFKQMPLWQKLGFDILAAIIIAMGVIFTTMIILVRILCRGKSKTQKLKQS